MNFKNYTVSNAPPSLYYIPNYITEEEEQFLLNKVYSAPKPKWTYLSHRKLQNWGGLPHAKGMIPEELPHWLQCYSDKIGDLGVFEDKKPNHVLVNEYFAGQGIMPHEDGPLFYPVVSTINLGSHTFLDFYSPLSSQENQSASPESDLKLSAAGHTDSSYESRYILSVLLEPRSLILVCDDMYKVYLHGIAERMTDVITPKVVNLNETHHIGDLLERKTRISLTFRCVPRLLKTKLLFGKK